MLTNQPSYSIDQQVASLQTRGMLLNEAEAKEVLRKISYFKIYENIKPNHPKRSAIANEFGLYISSDFSSWLKAIAELRNIIAHHSRLWNRSLSSPPATPKSTPYPWILTKLPPPIKSQPYCVITSTIYLCNMIQPKSQIKEHILKLIDNHPQIDITKYGFVGTWRKEPIWHISLKQRIIHWLLKFFHT